MTDYITNAASIILNKLIACSLKWYTAFTYNLRIFVITSTILYDVKFADM